MDLRICSAVPLLPACSNRRTPYNPRNRAIFFPGENSFLRRSTSREFLVRPRASTSRSQASFLLVSSEISRMILLTFQWAVHGPLPVQRSLWGLPVSPFPVRPLRLREAALSGLVGFDRFVFCV